MTALRSISSGRPRALGRYELLTEVAKSQLGPLSAARAGADGDPALIRTISTGSGLAEQEVDQLSEAAWWALELTHPNIAAARDVVMTEREIGLVSEYSEGEVLRSLIRVAGFRRMAIAPPIALRIVLDVLDAIAFACGEAEGMEGTTYTCGGLVPDSMLVGADGTTRLLDVGVAGVIAGLKPGHHPELAGYAAPERLAKSATLESAEVFSAAVVLWELLAGRRLFPGSTFDAVAVRINKGTVARLDVKTASSPIPGALADVVARGLELDPNARPARAADFAEALRKAADEVAEPEAVAKLVDTLAGGTLGTRRKLLERSSAEPEPPPEPKASPPEPAPAPAPEPKAGAFAVERQKVSNFPPQHAVHRAPQPTLLGVAPPSAPVESVEELVPESLDSAEVQMVQAPPKPPPRKRAETEPAASAQKSSPTAAEPTSKQSAAEPVDINVALDMFAAEAAPLAAPMEDSAAAPDTADTSGAAPDAAGDDGDAARPASDSLATEAPVPVRVQERTARARKWVAGIVGSMVLLLAVGLAASALRRPTRAPRTADSSLAAAPAPPAAQTATQPQPSAAPPPAPSAEAVNGADAASSAEVADSADAASSADAGSADAASSADAAASAVPPTPTGHAAPRRPGRHYYHAPRRHHTRPKRSFTPQGI